MIASPSVSLAPPTGSVPQVVPRRLETFIGRMLELAVHAIEGMRARLHRTSSY